MVRAEGCYIKIFRAGEATVPAERCAQTELLLGAGPFRAPRVMRSSADVIVFSSIFGRTLGELGKDLVTVSDAAFALLWENWSLAWTTQVGAHYDTARLSALAALPVHSPDVEVADLSRWVNRWLRHYGDLPEASSQRDALCARAEDVARDLLRSAPDPLVWAHGDLHDKQLIAIDGASALGLLDFDDTARAEAALDLANLDVHLEFLVRQQRLAPARYLTAHRQVIAAADRLQVSPDRFRAYSDAAWLRLACSPLPGRLSLALAALDERASHPPVRRAQELMT
ncbi:phosphotransferase [Arthrobacter sp. PAMC25564]|uniref:phosphotransferase n=1 Tax=Arthrobacter sp. PAMC25564 TaxID=2565366 RepID=UPI001F100082|nr:phosphotransferase [Arthrobacter sp. PAMC25564]